MGYYSHYIPNYSTIASPLTDALKGKIKKEKITWDEKCGKAFEELKAKLVSQPILFAPDFATDFILQTEASEVGAGVVLSQRIEGEEHPIVFLRKKVSKAERNYSTVERELAAIIFGLKRLKHYLDGQKFIIETDHNPLRSLPEQLTVALHTQWRIVLKGGKTTTVGRRVSAVGACVRHLLVGKTGRRKEKRKENEERRKRELEKTRDGRLGSGEEDPRVLFRDADQESKTRMRNNALRTGPRQAVE
ncbi:retrovirus-related Pol polyprotein from transposon 297 [Trichonephila clavipes]|nr:retrovirus-related Pol polyprotein from transposon 297 [Trichonephila clavipes]